LTFRVKFAPLVTLVRLYVSTKLEVFLQLSYFEKIGGTGRTVGRGETVNVTS